jgi:hypothetical protein
MAGIEEIRRYGILRNVHVHGADRGMVWQGHGLAKQHWHFWGWGGSTVDLPMVEFFFLREVAAPVSA